MPTIRILKLTLIAVMATAHIIYAVGASPGSASETGRITSGPPPPAEPFSPSNARTQDGMYIPVEQFFPAMRCASCHKDTHTMWSESLHRNAAREPFYHECADILLRTR